MKAVLAASGLHCLPDGLAGGRVVAGDHHLEPAQAAVLGPLRAAQLAAAMLGAQPRLVERHAFLARGLVLLVLEQRGSHTLHRVQRRRERHPHGAGLARAVLGARDQVHQRRGVAGSCSGRSLSAPERVDEQPLLAEPVDVPRRAQLAAQRRRVLDELVSHAHVGVGGGERAVELGDHARLAHETQGQLHALADRREVHLDREVGLAVLPASVGGLADDADHRLDGLLKVFELGLVVRREADLVACIHARVARAHATAHDTDDDRGAADQADDACAAEGKADQHERVETVAVALSAVGVQCRAGVAAGRPRVSAGPVRLPFACTRSVIGEHVRGRLDRVGGEQRKPGDGAGEEQPEDHEHGRLQDVSGG